MTKIVVLDGYALNPGDLSWQSLEALGSCVIYDRTSTADIVERARDADVVLTNKVALSRETLALLPNLKFIGVLATGYNIVDVAAATEQHIVVTNVPAYSTQSVAQLVFALLLEMAHHVGEHARGVREGRWSASPDFCYWNFPLMELAGLTMGIFGFGSIGKAVARIAEAFGMHVLVHTRTVPIMTGTIQFVTREKLFTNSDVISLHCPQTAETTDLINAENLALMKATAFLINTSRGKLVNENDLANALNQGSIAGAGLDVLVSEPPPLNNPLLTAKNCIITPHIAWATKAARIRLMKTVVQNVSAFLQGASQNVVA
jgi:glycerate dehydrogenase